MTDPFRQSWIITGAGYVWQGLAQSAADALETMAREKGYPGYAQFRDIHNLGALGPDHGLTIQLAREPS